MYVPLRVHGHHSLLTGVDAPARLVERAHELGLPGLALADVDTLSGLVDFLVAARRVGAGFRPIVAAEITDPDAPGRLIALVRDAAGYRNLCKLVSARQLGADPGAGGTSDGPFRLVESAIRHRAGLIFVADHPRLLIALGGHVAREDLFAAVSPASLAGRARRADERDCAGTRNAHLAPPARRPERGDEATEHALEPPKIPPPARALPAAELIDAARAVGVATLAVPDVHYALPAARLDHRVRTAIKHNALLEDLPEDWIAPEPAHLPSAAELERWYADLPEVAGPFRRSAGQRARSSRSLARATPGALARTLEVAARCDFAPELGGTLLPTIALDPGETPYSRLCALAFDGARRRYRPVDPSVVQRLEHELATIDRLGYAAYFLLVDALAGFARRAGIPCVGRGSAADSLVAYCLGLTDADPLRYGLLFERFLNSARRDRPDIDLDFCWRRRDEVIEHVYELFGPERTAMISTLNRCGLRAALREAALVHGIPPAEVERWSRKLPHHAPSAGDEPAAHDGGEPTQGFAEPAPRGSGEPGGGARERAGDLALNPLARALAQSPEAAGFPFEDERWQRVLRVAARLVDTPRHHGLHPGGVVVAPGPITDFVACQRAAKGVVVTQLDKDAVEAIGLVKMDLLGNRALTVLDDCLKELSAHGVALDLERLPEDDPATAETLRAGRTLGCSQIESPGMRSLLEQIDARTMDDVIQAVALIRPGPASSGMKDAYVRRARGREAATPPHACLTDVLAGTHGVMLYQEDVMRVAARFAGLDLAEADLLRRALQKRREHELVPLRQRFLDGARRRGVAHADARRVWELVANFASFGFCKAHAVTYGRIAYRTAWLKTHHPAVFLAAFLASDTGYYATRVYVEEARRLGIEILGPDVNRSRASFGVEWIGERAALRIGLAQVKGLSARTLAHVLEERARAPFLSLPDFLERSRAATDEADGLVRCGAFDAFDRTRPELAWRLHLLRAPARRLPRRPGEPALDASEIEACRDAGEPARRRASGAGQDPGGWSRRGFGLGRARLAPGDSAPLFDEPDAAPLALPRLPDEGPIARGRDEFELLGLSVRLHPTRLFGCPADERLAAGAHAAETRAGGPARPINPACCADLRRFEGGRVTLRGWPAATRRVLTADGRWMRFLTLEDESGVAEVVLFPDVYERDGRRLAELGTLCVTGKVESQMGACALHAERVW